MIPKVDINDGINFDFEVEEQPSYTPKLNPDTYRIEGFVDGIEAVKQAVYLILYVERYEWLIYSWNYGVELVELFGKNINFVIPEIERRFKEAIMQDDRVTNVTDFEFEHKKGSVTVYFKVECIFGEFKSKFEGVEV